MESRHLRRIGALPLVNFCLSGCSHSDLLLSLATPLPPTAPPSPAISPIPAPTESVTSTQPTPSFTGTPTFTNLGPSITSSETSNPSAMGTPAPPVVVPSQGTPDAPLRSIHVSVNQIFWGFCAPASTLITAHVDKTAQVESALLALRLENPRTADTTPCGGYAMMADGGSGNFSYRLTARSFNHYGDCLSAWGQFQLTAVGRNEEVLERSVQLLRLLVVSPCP